MQCDSVNGYSMNESRMIGCVRLNGGENRNNISFTEVAQWQVDRVISQQIITHSDIRQRPSFTGIKGNLRVLNEPICNFYDRTCHFSFGSAPANEPTNELEMTDAANRCRFMQSINDYMSSLISRKPNV